MSTMDNPHDSVVRQTLGRPEVAAGYFRYNLPKELLAHLDFATLERVQDSFVDPELHPSASDLLFTIDYSAEGNAKGKQEKKIKDSPASGIVLQIWIEKPSYHQS